MTTRPTARTVALAVVIRVVDHGGYSNLALPAALSRSGLSRADRDLATELAYGTIRRLLLLDRALAPLLDRALDLTPRRALALLRLGAYQLLFTRIPAYAAVSETVALAGPRERGFVNAVLRRLAADPPALPRGSEAADIAARTGLSEWAILELRRLVGAETEDAAAALATRASLTLRVNRSRTTIEELERALATAGAKTTRGRVYEGSILVEAGSPSPLPGFRQGWFAVQDQASSFVVGALDPRPGERVLDACAGPGGKTGHIADLVGTHGLVAAADSQPKRAGLVRASVHRLRLRSQTLVQDARRPALRGPFDRVLVDAPCSGIGSARRRPELLWRPRAEDLSALARLQVEIAASSAGLLGTGGRLVYSVCTFPRAETDAVCDALLLRAPFLEPLPIDGPDGPVERIRLWPHLHGTDAMFVAGFRRRN